MRPGVAAERARVHRQRTADGSRDAGEELGGTDLPAGAVAGEHGAGNARLGLHDSIAEVAQVLEAAGRDDNDAAHPAVADEQVAAQSYPVHGELRIQPAQEI